MSRSLHARHIGKATAVNFEISGPIPPLIGPFIPMVGYSGAECSLVLASALDGV